MDENVQKELETLKGMVLAWKRSYLELAASDGGEYLVQEFLDEIETHVCPYVRRLYDCNYLSQSEAAEFLNFCYKEVEDLRNSLRQAEAEQLHIIWPEGREKESFSPH